MSKGRSTSSKEIGWVSTEGAPAGVCKAPHGTAAAPLSFHSCGRKGARTNRPGGLHPISPFPCPSNGLSDCCRDSFILPISAATSDSHNESELRDSTISAYTVEEVGADPRIEMGPCCSKGAPQPWQVLLGPVERERSILILLLTRGVCISHGNVRINTYKMIVRELFRNEGFPSKEATKTGEEGHE